MQAGDRALKEQKGAEACEEVDSARFARCFPRHGCHSDYCGPGHPQQVCLKSCPKGMLDLYPLAGRTGIGNADVKVAQHG